MNDLEDLYREMIIEHKKNPRNYCRLAEPTHKSEGHNPVCGDQLTVYLRIEDDVLKEVGFEGQGCAVSTASASIMTERLKGLSLDEIRRLFGLFRGMVTTSGDVGPVVEDLGKPSVLAGVRKYPMRVKCATLPWHTLMAALDGMKIAKTE